MTRETRAAPTRALVVHPFEKRGALARARDLDARLTEAVGLAEAIDLDVCDAIAAPLSAPRPATLIGQGKVEEIAARIAAEDIELAIVDAALTPVQQHNLEKAWGAKVLDRTGLILEIFGARARTREGRLQVELAHLTYQKGRLVRSWTHLERQRGGAGFLGGPGETQIEADRRALSERIARIEKALAQVTRTRALHRADRKRAPHPIVALSGYTNAGKSTLFNRLTSGEVLSADMLFATLDPTLRSIPLPSGRRAILSDTVGFVSALPHDLVAAFRATLEEVRDADLIVHVRDISHPDSAAQAEDVRGVLAELGVAEERLADVIEAWNKADLLDDDAGARVREAAQRTDDAYIVSAATGQGIDALIAAIDARLGREAQTIALTAATQDGAAIAWIHANAEVVEEIRDAAAGVTRLTVRISEKDLGRLGKRYPEVSAAPPPTGEAD